MMARDSMEAGSGADVAASGVGEDLFCDDFVPKPYSPRQLLAKIRKYLP